MPKYYKFLDADDCGPYSNFYRYELPKDKRPGKWMKIVGGNIAHCSRGWHVTTLSGLLNWSNNYYKLYEVEIRKNVKKRGSKTVAREMRFVKFIGYIPPGYHNYVNNILINRGITNLHDAGYKSKFGRELLKLVKNTPDRPY